MDLPFLWELGVVEKSDRTGVVGTLPLPLRGSIVSQLASYFFGDIPKASEKTIRSEEDLRWVLETLGQAFSLPIPEHEDTIAKTIEVYFWLLNEHPIAREKFVADMLRHVMCVFECRTPAARGGGAVKTPREKQEGLINETLSHLLKFVSTSKELLKRTGHITLLVELVNGALRYTTSDKGVQEVVRTTSAAVLDIIIACEVNDEKLWNFIKAHLTPNSVVVAENWASAFTSLTVTISSAFVSKSALAEDITTTYVCIHDGVTPVEGKMKSFCRTWSEFLTLLGNLGEIKSLLAQRNAAMGISNVVSLVANATWCNKDCAGVPPPSTSSLVNTFGPAIFSILSAESSDIRARAAALEALSEICLRPTAVAKDDATRVFHAIQTNGALTAKLTLSSSPLSIVHTTIIEKFHSLFSELDSTIPASTIETMFECCIAALFIPKSQLQQETEEEQSKSVRSNVIHESVLVHALKCITSALTVLSAEQLDRFAEYIVSIVSLKHEHVTTRAILYHCLKATFVMSTCANNDRSVKLLDEVFDLLISLMKGEKIIADSETQISIIFFMESVVCSISPSSCHTRLQKCIELLSGHAQRLRSFTFTQETESVANANVVEHCYSALIRIVASIRSVVKDQSQIVNILNALDSGMTSITHTTSNVREGALALLHATIQASLWPLVPVGSKFHSQHCTSITEFDLLPNAKSWKLFSIDDMRLLSLLDVTDEAEGGALWVIIRDGFGRDSYNCKRVFVPTTATGVLNGQFSAPVDLTGEVDNHDEEGRGAVDNDLLSVLEEMKSATPDLFSTSISNPSPTVSLTKSDSAVAPATVNQLRYHRDASLSTLFMSNLGLAATANVRQLRITDQLVSSLKHLDDLQGHGTINVLVAYISDAGSPCSSQFSQFFASLGCQATCDPHQRELNTVSHRLLFHEKCFTPAEIHAELFASKVAAQAAIVWDESSSPQFHLCYQHLTATHVCCINEKCLEPELRIPTIFLRTLSCGKKVSVRVVRAGGGRNIRNDLEITMLSDAVLSPKDLPPFVINGMNNIHRLSQFGIFDEKGAALGARSSIIRRATISSIVGASQTFSVNEHALSTVIRNLVL